MDGSNIDLSVQQREILAQFRENLKDLLTPEYTDTILLKWLRARNFNLKKAEINFREVQWTRMTYGINRLVDTYVQPEVFKFKGDTFLGYAKDGTPIRYLTARIDYYGFLESVSSYNLALYFCYVMECDIKALQEENKRNGCKNHEITYIYDMEGYSLLQLTNKTVTEIGLDSFRLLQEHYPEVWGNIFLINAPYIFDKLFNIFKPIFKDTLSRKCNIVSKDATGEFLRRYIDEDVLPAFLGGKRVDSKGDINCREFINYGGKIPEEYYLRNSMHFIDETQPGVKMVTIGPRSVFNVPLIAKEKGSNYRLEMRTENGSLVFSVLYREFGSDPENPDFPKSDEYLDPHDESCNVSLVAARLKTHSHIAPNDGRGFVINPGIYILQFDNTNSWFTSRKLFYRVTLYPPDD